MREEREVPAEAGPLATRGRGLAAVLFLVVPWTAGCATAGGPDVSSPAPEVPEDSPDAERAEERKTAAAAAGVADALEEVRLLIEAGRADRAARIADSLYFTSLGALEEVLRAGPTGGADEERESAGGALRRAAAAALLVEARALRATGDLRSAAARMRELMTGFPDGPAAREAAPELVDLRLALGDDPGAVQLYVDRPGLLEARPALLDRALSGLSASEARSLARRARAEGRGSLAGRLEAELRRLGAATGPVRIGLLLPGSGRYEQVGRWVREGVELAVQGEDARGEAGRAVELVTVRSDGPGGIEAAVRELEQAGVVAVVGPLRYGPLEEVSAARRQEGLLFVSPTARRSPSGARGLYTLWDRTRRELDAARELGSWLSRSAVGRAGVLFASSDLGRRSYLVFARSLESSGAFTVAGAPYDPGATTFEEAVSAVSAFGPHGVYVMGADPNSVLQLAPQLSYYGIRGALVAGGTAWSDAATVRRLEPSFTQLRVTAVFVDRTDDESAWSSFRRRYERTHRRALANNPIPALGHDAALLVLRALPGEGAVRPRAMTRAFGSLGPVEGATGRLHPDPSGGTVSRRVLVRKIADRGLSPVGRDEVTEWLAGSVELAAAGRRTRRAAALRAVEDARLQDGEGPGADGRGGGRP